MKFVYKILPYFIIRNNRLVSNGFEGSAYWMFIVIRRDIELTKALLEHEIIHVKQIWRYTPLLFAILYFGFQKYKLKFEVEAYKETLKYNKNETPESIAEMLHTKYKIDKYSVETIVGMLKEYKIS